MDLTRASPDDVAADPGARAAWDYARHAPPRPGETVTLSRFVVDRDTYQGPSPTLNAIPILTLQRYLGTPKLAWDFVALAEPERWNEYFAAADVPRAAGADFRVGGRRFGLFAHDFRRVPVDALLELVSERALARTSARRRRRRRRHCLVLSHPDSTTRFDRRCGTCADRTCWRATRWCGPACCRPRRRGEPGRRRWRRWLRAVDALPSTLATTSCGGRWSAPTWPAATQERTAEALGLPFSTYRRHLTQGVARIVAVLWDQEVYGSGLSRTEQFPVWRSSSPRRSFS